MIKSPLPSTTVPPVEPPPIRAPICSSLLFKFNVAPLVFASATQPLSLNTPAAPNIIDPALIVVPPK